MILNYEKLRGLVNFLDSLVLTMTIPHNSITVHY